MVDEERRSVGWDSERISRRKFIIGAASVTAAGAATGLTIRAIDNPAELQQNLVPIRMAMHVHASASEGSGSMLAQLVQAQRAGVDVLWWTEHDHRMSAHAAPALISFSGMTESPAGAAPWTWTAATQGSTGAGTAHAFCTQQSHPEISPRTNALLLRAQPKDTHLTVHQLSGQSENLLNRTSIAGLTITVAVFPVDLSEMSHAAIDILTSYRPSDRSTPAGTYRISYHIGGAGVPGTSRVIGKTDAVVTFAAPANQWTTLSITPELDLARLWPGVDGRDSGLVDFILSAGAYGREPAKAFFSELQFHRADITRSRPLQLQAELIAEYAPRFPTIHQIQALEVSLTTPHIGWYGGSIELPDYDGAPFLPSLDPSFARAAVNTIHRQGGLASYCHPFGTSTQSLSADAQEAARRAKAAELVGNSALGCDLLEVGYRLRGGCNLEQHESIWDNCSRNGIFLTGLGVNDDHNGRDWLGEQLNFVTWAWSASNAEADLLKALRQGRVYFGDPSHFGGSLDLRIGGRSVMGSLSIADAARRTITLVATGLPDGARIEILRGTVDFAGPGDTSARIERSRLSASELDTTGEARITIDTGEPRFVRIVVKDRSGLAVGFSNPVWLLRELPKRTSGAAMPAAQRARLLSV